ncbi:hypothetical protein, partial [Methylobacterium sp. J-068]|uniref:hypothetical protein n=1 Tax=Methylobacterium sp. J-068 TaxID=2836649 RepID=UPI001FB9706F
MTRMLPLAALALACAFSSPALAAEVVAAPTALVLPVGDWLSTFFAAVVPSAVTLIAGAITVGISKVAPWAALFLSQKRIETTVQTAVDYGLNAVEGATKGAKLSVPVGSAVVAKALQRVIDSTPQRIIDKAGGLPEIGARIFRA